MSTIAHAANIEISSRTCVSTTDNQNRSKATSVVIAGLAKTGQYQKARSVAPKTKNSFDYLLIIVLLSSVMVPIKSYLDSNGIEQSFFFGIPAVIALMLLGRRRNLKALHLNAQSVRKLSCSIRELSVHETTVFLSRLLKLEDKFTNQIL